MRARPAAALAVVAALSASLAPVEAAPVPYVVPDDGSVSFYGQPWRSYAETVPATQFLDGVGVGWKFPAGTDDAAAMHLLAEAGFRTFRLEVPWSVMAYPGDELDATLSAPIADVLDAARDEGLRPLILLNANHGDPGPHEETTVTVVSGGSPGSRRLVVTPADGLVAGHSGISNLTQVWMDEVLFTSVDPATGVVALSKPLPAAIADGAAVTVDTLRYLPLHGPGDAALDDTVDGWVAYARAVMGFVEDRGIDDFALEIWNETTFGSNFLDIANYDTSFSRQGPEKFQPGGSAWTLAARTTEMATQEFPEVEVVWGFSNTNALGTTVEDLPPGTDAESFHPYHTAPIVSPDDFPIGNLRNSFSYVPHLVRAMPEGQQQLALGEHTIIRDRLAPAVRGQHPPDSDSFTYLFSEHGVTPSRAGITEPEAAYDYKARAALRILAFWLNKGVQTIELSSSYKPEPSENGLAGTDIAPADYGNHDMEDLLSPPLLAIRNLTRAFEGAEPLSAPRQLDFDIESVDPPPEIFAGDASHRPLTASDVFALLPYQVTESRFVVPAYVMTYDLRARLPDTAFRVTIHNVLTDRLRVRLYDPLTDEDLDVSDLAVGAHEVAFTMPVSDTPRLILLDEDPSRPLPAVVRWGATALAAVLVLAILAAFASRRETRRPLRVGAARRRGQRP